MTPQLQARTWVSATVTRVVDGDSLWVRPDDGSKSLRLRLHGVDAPEICQPHGSEARQALVARLAVAADRVNVQLLHLDTYDRWLARVETRDGDLGAWLVLNGHAWSSSRTPGAQGYASELARARRERTGLFADGQAEHPRDFRRRHGPCHAPN